MRFLLILTVMLPLGLFASAPVKKGLYVDHLPELLGKREVAEDFFLMLSQGKFNHLVLYDLHKVLRDKVQSETLKTFIRKAREHGIMTVSAAGETASSFSEYIIPWHKAAPKGSGFDDLYLELEFWQAKAARAGGMYASYIQKEKLTADTSGLFVFYRAQLSAISGLAKQNGLTTSTYVGWFNQGQANVIASHADHIWVHAYNPHVERLFGYSRSRLEMLARAGASHRSFPIFSAEDEFSGIALKKGLREGDVYSAFVKKAESEGGKSLFGQGYMWFARTRLQNATQPGLSLSSFQKPSTGFHPVQAR